MSLKKEQIIENNKNILISQDFAFKDILAPVISDLKVLSSYFLSKEVFDDAEIKNQFRYFADIKKVYDQIRFIDNNGDEKIRINYFPEGSEIVNENDLQNKKDRYYFSESINLDKNSVYVSKIDLNMENGVIEKPLKPMIRFSEPVYNNKGEKLGVIVLNYYAEGFLKIFSNISNLNSGENYILNAQSYWILGPKDYEWGFMYEDKKEINFKNFFPEEWEYIKENKTGYIITDNGLFSFKLFDFNFEMADNKEKIVCDENSLIFISYVKINTENNYINVSGLAGYLKIIFLKYYFHFIYTFIFSVFAAFILARRKIITEKMMYFAQYDGFTDVYNRRTGMEILKKDIISAYKNKKDISLNFIDINYLKKINDSFGHESGDELILTVVNTVKSNLEKNDYIIRLGGDEFAVVFINKRADYAESNWNKVINDIEKINTEEKRLYNISVSHGISEFIRKEGITADDLIKEADSKMYYEKNIIKKASRKDV